MKSARKKSQFSSYFKVDWRVLWYSVLIWLLAFFVSGFFILPWYFLALPFFVLLVTVVYFRQESFKARMGISKKYPSYILAQGLWIGFLWFVFVLLFDLLEFAGFTGSSPTVFASDPRNFLKYPVIILIPFIYSLVLENKLKNAKFKKSRFRFASPI